MNMVKILNTASVVGVALHQHKLRIDCQDGANCFLHVSNGSCAGGKQDGFTLAGNILQRLQPVNLSRSNLMGWHKGIQVIHCFKIVR